MFPLVDSIFLMSNGKLLYYAAPEFHLVIQEGSNGEVYNMAIRGTNLGGSDGVDVWGE